MKTKKIPKSPKLEKESSFSSLTNIKILHSETNYQPSNIFFPEIFKNSKIKKKPLTKYNNYLLIQQTRAITSLTILITALTSYEYFPLKNQKSPKMLNYLLITTFFLSFVSVFLYILSLYFYGKYLKLIGKILENSNVFYYVGVHKVFFYCVLLLVNFNLWNGEVLQVKSDMGFFYDNEKKEKIFFKRKIRDLLLIVKFCVHFFTILECLMKISKPSLPLGNDSINRLKAKSIFVMKIYLQDYFIFSIFFIMISKILFFSVILRILENSFFRTLKEDDFSNIYEFQNFIRNHHNFGNYKNCIWIVIMTQTTIGYGDIFPSTLFGRILVFFLIIIGLVNISYLVVGFLKIFEISKSQKMILDIFNATEMKDKMKLEVGQAIHCFIYKKIQKRKWEKNKKENYFIKDNNRESRINEQHKNFKTNTVINKNLFLHPEQRFSVETPEKIQFPILKTKTKKKSIFFQQKKNFKNKEKIKPKLEIYQSKELINIKNQIEQKKTNLDRKLTHDPNLNKYEVKTKNKHINIHKKLFLKRLNSDPIQKTMTPKTPKKSHQKSPKKKKKNPIKINELNSKSLKTLKKVQDILFLYSKNYKKGMMEMIIHIENYKLLKYEYNSTYGPENIDYLKFLVYVIDDIIDDIILYACIKDFSVFKKLEVLEEKEKKFFKMVFYLFPYAKAFFDRQKRRKRNWKKLKMHFFK